MQTFLPYAAFDACARVLDDRRLANQIKETTVILRTLLGTYAEGKGWPHHPVTKMWKGREACLGWYQQACCNEYLKRTGQHHTGRYTLEGLHRCLALPRGARGGQRGRHGSATKRSTPRTAATCCARTLSTTASSAGPSPLIWNSFTRREANHD